MTAKRVEGWQPGDPLPAPGTIVGDISLHAPGVRFGVVLAPESSDRVKRITSDDPAIWKPAIAEYTGAVWSRDEQRAAKDLEEAQQRRYGVTGMAILGIDEDEEAAKRDAEWAAPMIDDDLEALLADL